MTDREIIILLAERVMGWERTWSHGPDQSGKEIIEYTERGTLRTHEIRFGFLQPQPDGWNPLAFVENAWMVVDAMYRRGLVYNLNCRDQAGEPHFWPADHHCSFAEAPSDHLRCHHGHGDTITRAICLAALAAIGVEAKA
jgi:hypothetical protein